MPLVDLPPTYVTFSLSGFVCAIGAAPVMAHSYPTPQAAMTSYIPAPVNVPENLAPYSIFGPIQFPESVALWHISSSQRPPSSTPVTSYPSPSSSLNQYPTVQPVLDQKKHKRTRSGCFTCRSGRIKCDEVRPVCDRCRKGNRECTYPSPSQTGSRPGGKSKGSRPQSYESDSSCQVEQDEVHVLEPIADGDEGDEGSVESESHPSTPSVASRPRARVPKRQNNPPSRGRKSKAALEAKEDSSSPSTESSKFECVSAHSAGASHGHFTPEPLGFRGNNQLPEDLRFYLTFCQESINYHHFFQKQGSESFFSRGIVNIALQYEPLLYAVVGFAAYHHSMTATGKLSTFLKYYNKALSLLRKSLGSGEKHCEATLITVLLLATFEVRPSAPIPHWLQLTSTRNP